MLKRLLALFVVLFIVHWASWHLLGEVEVMERAVLHLTEMSGFEENFHGRLLLATNLDDVPDRLSVHGRDLDVYSVESVWDLPRSLFSGDSTIAVYCFVAGGFNPYGCKIKTGWIVPGTDMAGSRSEALFWLFCCWVGSVEKPAGLVFDGHSRTPNKAVDTDQNSRGVSSFGEVLPGHVWRDKIRFSMRQTFVRT